MTLYASQDYARSIMGTLQQAATPTTLDNAKILRNLRQVSQRVDRVFASRRPVFAPWNETRLFPLDGARVNSSLGTFRIDGHLLALTSLLVDGNAVTAVEGYPDNTTPPFNLLRLTDCCTGWYGTCSSDCCAPQQVSINGIWGYSSDYAHAWLEVDALAAALTTTSATTLTVASAAGNDAYGQPYRISPGHLLKIDSEYLEVTGVSTNTVTVIRGANGSTAATHLISATVYRWEVPEDIQRAVARQAGLFYGRMGAYSTVEISPMGGEVRYPADFLQEVWGVLQGFAYGG